MCAESSASSANPTRWGLGDCRSSAGFHLDSIGNQRQQVCFVYTSSFLFAPSAEEGAHCVQEPCSSELLIVDPSCA